MNKENLELVQALTDLAQHLVVADGLPKGMPSAIPEAHAAPDKHAVVAPAASGPHELKVSLLNSNGTVAHTVSAGFPSAKAAREGASKFISRGLIGYMDKTPGWSEIRVKITPVRAK